jgi:hypothetical protein
LNPQASGYPLGSSVQQRRLNVAEVLAVVAPISFLGAMLVAWSQLRRW